VRKPDLEHGSSPPGAGLCVDLGVFDDAAFARYVEPALAGISQEPRAVLWLCEAIADARDIAHREHAGELDPELETLGLSAEGLLLTADDLEDAGFDLDTLEAAPGAAGRRWRTARAAFLATTIRHSTALQRTLDPTADDDAIGAIEGEVLQWPRHHLLYWLVAVHVVDFRAWRLVPRDRFLPIALEATSRWPLLALLQGQWGEWPRFDPDAVLPMRGQPLRGVEPVPIHGWALRSADEVAEMASALTARLARFLHLCQLRSRATDLHEDLLSAWSPELDEVMLEDYEQVMAQRQWDEVHRACYEYVMGARARRPSTLPSLGLSIEHVERHVGDVLDALRGAYRVLLRAAEEGTGIYAIFGPHGEAGDAPHRMRED